MEIILYSTQDDDLRVSKSLTALKTLSNINLLDEDEINTPSFIVTAGDDLLPCNYAYIAKYHRYYFAKVTILDGLRFRVDMTVDRLMSFIQPNKAALSGYVERNENNFNKDIVDDQAVFTNDRDIKTVAITVNGIAKPLENWKLIGVFNAGLCNTVEEVTP
jgi:hypothetical protein